jgi:signal-transduction protein with cAMP-binding, CBS, and nucleotidyltransferase domain
MKSLHEKDVREKVMFLKRTAPFQEMSDGAIKKFAFESKWVNFKIGDVICVQGQPLNDLFFVRKGECKILADYELDGVQGKLKLGRYSQYEYFGQEASMEPGAMARFTVVADYTMTASDKRRNLRATEIKEKFSVECLQFRCFDMKDLRTLLRVGVKIL